MKTLINLESEKKIFNFLYVWCTHVNKKNEKNKTSLQTKLQKKWISTVLSMWSTQASKKKKIIFEPLQPPCKLNLKMFAPSVLSM
jgi:hypothetical protein